MCDAISAGFAVFALAGTALQIRAQQQLAQSQQRQAAFQAQVARNNAILSQRAADDARKRGRIEETQRRQLTRQQIGQQEVRLAGSGQVIGQGSALDITVDTAGVGELDALTIRNNAEREALGFEIQGVNFAAGAGALDARGRSAITAGRTAAFGTLLTGVARAGSMLTFAPAAAASPTVGQTGFQTGIGRQGFAFGI